MHLEAIIEGLRGGHGSVWFQIEVESESEPKFLIRFDLGVFKALTREKHNQIYLVRFFGSNLLLEDAFSYRI